MSYHLSRAGAEAEASEYLDPKSIEQEEAMTAAIFRAQAALMDACNAYNRNNSLGIEIDVEAIENVFHDELPSIAFILEKLAEVTPPQRN